MRLVFMGTPDFAVETLKALSHAGHTVACASSQPPRPAGRGMAERPSPVHAFAASQGIEVRTPVSLKSPEEQARFAAVNADAAVVVAYGLLLPKAILDAPRMGCFNVHASLLPRWRGAAPVQRAIMAGDAETGVTIMRMEEGLDTGPMCRVGRIAITPATTDDELLRQMRAGDARAFAALYRRHQGPLYRFALLRCGSAGTAADMVQEAFMGLLIGSLAFDPLRGSLPNFLFGVARLLTHRLMVMQGGRVVEDGLTDQVLDDPQHAYTQMLVASILPV